MPTGLGDLATRAVAVGTNATSLVNAKITKKGIMFQPIGGDIFLGGPDVTIATGIKLKDGVVFTDTESYPWHGICASGTVDTRVADKY